VRPDDPPERAGAADAGRSDEGGWLRERTEPLERVDGAGEAAGGLTRDGAEERGACDHPPVRGGGIEVPGEAGSGSRDR